MDANNANEFIVWTKVASSRDEGKHHRLAPLPMPKLGKQFLQFFAKLEEVNKAWFYRAVVAWFKGITLEAQEGLWPDVVPKGSSVSDKRALEYVLDHLQDEAFAGIKGRPALVAKAKTILQAENGVDTAKNCSKAEAVETNKVFRAMKDAYLAELATHLK